MIHTNKPEGVVKYKNELLKLFKHHNLIPKVKAIQKINKYIKK